MSKNSKIIDAKITKTFLGREDHGIFTFIVEYSGIGEYKGRAGGFGTYQLDIYNRKTGEQIGTAFGMELLIKTIETIGAKSWEDLINKKIKVKIEGNEIKDIGNFKIEKWVNPKNILRKLEKST